MIYAEYSDEERRRIAEIDAHLNAAGLSGGVSVATVIAVLNAPPSVDLADFADLAAPDEELS